MMDSTTEEKKHGEENHDHGHGGHCRRGRCWRIPFFILGFVLIKSAIVFWLWNALIPDLFHGPTVNFPQAIGLVVLAKVLFGGFRGGHGGRGGPPWRRWH